MNRVFVLQHSLDDEESVGIRRLPAFPSARWAAFSFSEGQCRFLSRAGQPGQALKETLLSLAFAIRKRALFDKCLLNPLERKIALKLMQQNWRVLRNGAPDFFCIRVKDGERQLMAVEVKHGNDQLSPAQIEVKAFLEELGLPVVVVRDDEPIHVQFKQIFTTLPSGVGEVPKRIDSHPAEILTEGNRKDRDSLTAGARITSAHQIGKDKKPSDVEAVDSRTMTTEEHRKALGVQNRIRRREFDRKYGKPSTRLKTV